MRLIALFSLTALFAGCTTAELITGSGQPAAGENIRYSAVYVIHADGDYLYYDNERNPRQADRKVLREAKLMGEGAAGGEVFIFHQLPERKILWMFPKKDRRLLHYRNGELVRTQRYSPRTDDPVLSAEAELYSEYSAGTTSDSLQRFFFYFGHQIPEEGGKGYHRSLPGKEMNTRKFGESLRLFLPSEAHKFALTALSTCNNGSPSTVHLLQPHTGILLASPQNLHLSHIDTRELKLLESEGKIPPVKLANAIAEDSFNRLSDLQTAVTLTVYDMERVGKYISGMASAYRAHLEEQDFNRYDESTDCSDLAFLKQFDAGSGVQKWYKPPAFGRKAGKQTHSGWGCADKVLRD